MSDRRANHSSTRSANPTRCSLAAGLALIALAAIASCATVPITEPIAEAGGEILVGVHVDAGGQMVVFRGIPYAAPPAGELRWRPPEPHVPRAGRQDASRFGSACPQLQRNPDWYRDVAEKFGRPGNEIADLTDIREDCLYLNVWTQNLAGDEPQPVMVWIHGGANVGGVAHEPNYLGYNLAKRDVVIVSINYRLGALGFLAHPALSAESERGVSGNYGLLDQIAALEWVRDNIASFGGDPDQVTVFGESAGAADIGTLIVSPLGKGLFRRAIIQSGYSVYYRETLRDAEAVGEEFLRTLGVDDGPGQLKQMRALSWQDIVAAVPTAAPGGLRDAVIDGWLLPKAAIEIFEAQEQNPTEIVIGTNVNEWFMYFTHPVDQQQLHAALKKTVRDGHRAEVLTELKQAVGGDFAARLDLLVGSTYFHCPSLAIADAQRQVTDHVYVYRFSRVRPMGEKLLAYHGAEIPYAFDTADYWLPADEIDWALTDIMTAYWTQFAKTGNPNSADTPNWPTFDPKRDVHQDLGDEVRTAVGLQRELCEALARGRI
jgi:para-nitrobenzyl esterase